MTFIDCSPPACLPACLQVGPSQRLPLDQVQRLWSDYFVFSFVRNPWNRAVSSYLMMMRALEWEPVPESITASNGGTDGAGSSSSSSNDGGFVGGHDGSDSGGAAALRIGGALVADPAEAPQQVGRQMALQRHRYKLPAARQYRWNDFCIDPGSFQPVCEQDARCRR